MTERRTNGGPPEDLHRMEEAVRALKHDAPPAGLAERIASDLARLPLPRRSPLRRLRELLQRPAVTWAYRLATLLLLGGILWGVRDLVAERRNGKTVPGPAPGVSLVSGVKAPEASSKVRVTFLFKAPQAQSVSVAGTFNGWDAEKDPMSRGKDGEWVLQMDLAPGQYEYQFVVDGSKFVPDPNALEEREDGLGNANAVLRL
jgi:hypothetical protein